MRSPARRGAARRLARRAGVALAAPALVLAGLLAGSLLAARGGGGALRPAAAAAPLEGADRTPATRLTPRRAAGAERTAPRRGVSLGALARRDPLAVYARRAGARPRRELHRPVPGAPLVLLVRERRRGWLRVLLPVRPNGSSGWVRARDVRLRTDPYRVTIDLRARRLRVRRAGRTVLVERVATGADRTPTPAGLAYISLALRQPDPRGPYGPWALGLSLHSRVLTSFGGGDGQVGIHGTDAPRGIGRAISHGCIRMRNAAIVRLARNLPLGTPVRIIG